MSAPAATQSVPDVAVNDATETADRPASRMLAQVVRGARRVPFTIGVVALIVVLGVVGEGWWRRVDRASWFPDIAYGLPPLREAKVWTPITGMPFGLTPAQYVTMTIAFAVLVGWAEWRLGTVRTAAVAVGGQVVGVLGAAAFLAIFDETDWDWADRLAEVRDVGLTTAIVAAVAAASATLRSPWRLRARAILTAYVAIAFLFEGTLADVQHLVAFAVALPVGERWFSRGERGLWPRTRQEVRMLGFVGLLLIGVVEIAVWLFPGNGPLGPTDTVDTGSNTGWSAIVDLVIIALVALQLRRGRRWAWWLTVIFGSLTVLATALVMIAVVAADYSGEGAVALGTSLLWLGLVILLIAGRWAFSVPLRRRQAEGGEAVDDAPARVRELLHADGGSTMSWMITWELNRYFFVDDATAVVGYQRHAGVLLALADPVCPPDRLEHTVAAFVAMADHSGRTPCWFSVGENTAEVVRRQGWRATQIAEDTIIDLPDLEFKGKPWQHVRSAMNRAKKEGISLPAHQPGRRAVRGPRAGSRDLRSSGSATRTCPKWVSPSAASRRRSTRRCGSRLAVDEGGSIHGVLSWLPVYGPADSSGQPYARGWTLDVMRRRDDGFKPVMEFLIASSAVAFKEQGAQFVSLSGAPLAKEEVGADTDTMDRMLDTLGAALEAVLRLPVAAHVQEEVPAPLRAGVHLLPRRGGSAAHRHRAHPRVPAERLGGADGEDGREPVSSHDLSGRHDRRHRRRRCAPCVSPVDGAAGQAGNADHERARRGGDRVGRADRHHHRRRRPRGRLR